MQDKIIKIKTKLKNYILTSILLNNKKIYLLLILTFIMVISFCNSIWGYTGKGTYSSPFVVTTGSELKEVLTEYPDRSGWTYVAINDTIAVQNPIHIEGGNYFIYAKGANRTIRRSRNLDAKVNSQKDPKYCFYIAGDTKVVWGNNLTNYKLILEGSKDIFTTGKCSGFWHIYSGVTNTLSTNCIMQNVCNTVKEDHGGPINSQGELGIYGTIKDCQGINGGAIRTTDGKTTIYSSGKIDWCESITEGGAIYGAVGANINMEGGTISNCQSAEEGGAIFVEGSGQAYIRSGTITKNKSGTSAGGIFSGYGARLVIGTRTSGPIISNNYAYGSGGGIRCNGGDSELKGGTTYFYNGTISGNHSTKYGGGIACGPPGTDSTSKINIEGIKVSNNISEVTGGGIWIGDGVIGTEFKAVQLTKTTITGNISNGSAGGIMIHNKVIGTSNSISSNHAYKSGGGAFVDDEAEYKSSTDEILNNKATVNGNGIYLQGLLKISSNFYIKKEDEIYLSKDTYIDVIGDINVQSELIASIDSEIKSNGTKLVKVNYIGVKASEFLYIKGDSISEYFDKDVQKKFQHIYLENDQCIRPGDNAKIGTQWIIISEKYTIKYNKNTEDEVSNMPKEVVKFWNEDIILSDNDIERKRYNTNKDTHWNTLKDGKGITILPGKKYTLNGNYILYAQWILKEPTRLYITAPDRYYIKGQKIILNCEEILKKVEVKDDIDSGEKYKISVIKIQLEDKSILNSGENLLPEKSINTKEKNHYIVKLYSSTDNKKVSVTQEMNIFIVDNIVEIGEVRFISKEFENTLPSNSKWRSATLENILNKTLEKQVGDGVFIIEINKDELKKLKGKIKENNYITNNSFLNINYKG